MLMQICEKSVENWQAILKINEWNNKSWKQREKEAEEAGFHEKGSFVIYAVSGKV